MSLVIFSILALPIIVKLYLKLTTGWCKSKVCLVGKTVLVTGSNTGIGYETALDFAQRGARVILASRNEEKLKEAQRQITKETHNENIIIKMVDMSSFESVRKFAKDVNDSEPRLDILVNNAGAGGIKEKRTEDGHILITQINYFSPFLLTHLLLPLMKKTGTGRIVNVSSIAARHASNFDVQKIDQYPGDVLVYNYSKLGNILFTQELARKLKSTSITTYSLHPGAVKTEIFRHTRGLIKLIFDLLMNSVFKSAEEGAQTTVYCAVQRDIEQYSGEHFSDCKKVEAYKTTKAPFLAENLWKETERIVNLRKEERI